MKATFHILLVLVVPAMALATEQQPDILHYGGLELEVSTGWATPAPLETYYYQNNFAYPFDGWSTANYRGHIAVWKIVDDDLYLTEILLEEPNEADPEGWDWVLKSHEPSEYGVKARSGPPAENGDVFADWFSGVLDCYLLRNGTYTSYLFHVRQGDVVGMEIITDEDYDILYNTIFIETLPLDLRRKYDMLVLNENYLTYYFRLCEEDAIAFNGQDCRLRTGYDRLSPLYGLYDNSHLQWPYNWENMTQCGAPHCRWAVRDGKLYLTGLELYGGLSFYEIDTEILNLAALFNDRVVNGVMFADWVSGVYLIKHGYVTEEDAGWPGYTFTVFHLTELTYIRIAEGRVTESYTVPKDFSPSDMSEDAPPGLRRIILDYQLPSVFDTPQGGDPA